MRTGKRSRFPNETKEERIQGVLQTRNIPITNQELSPPEFIGEYAAISGDCRQALAAASGNKLEAKREGVAETMGENGGEKTQNRRTQGVGYLTVLSPSK